MPHIILFSERNFQGAHVHVVREEPSLHGHNFNNTTSSFVVMEGRWKLYRDEGYQIPYDQDFGPGLYPWVEDFGVDNDAVQSLGWY